MGHSICMTAQVTELPTDEQAALATEVLKLLAEPTRLRIVWALLHGEHAVGDLANHLGARPAAISQHLAKLRLGRLVKTRREGSFVFYQAENAHVRRLVEEALSHAHHVGRGLPDHAEPGAPTSRKTAS